MASSRKSLITGYTYLSRRFRPVFFHTPHDDRERSGGPQSPPLSLTSSMRGVSGFLQPFGGFRSPIRDRRRASFAFPLGIDHCSLRSYSSGLEPSNEVGYFNGVADVLTESAVDTSAATVASVSASTVPASFSGEVAAAAADSFPPVAALQHLIDAVHSFTGLNWWASIALTTLLIRGATIPLLINQMKASVKLSIMRPELEKLKAEIDRNMDPGSIQEGQKRMKALFNKHGVTPLTPLKGALIQGPIFISFFFAISNMVEKVPSLKSGGAFWFTDLTTPDAMYIFPVLTSLTFLATVELNMQEGMEGNPMGKTMKNFSRVLAVLTVPFTAGFPKAVFCYWVTSNFFSFFYGFVLKRPQVRKYLKLPDSVPEPAPAAKQPNLFSSFSASEPILPTASSREEKGSLQLQSPDRRASSSSVISQRIRNLEKTVKARNKLKKR
ncbi:Mitochondrial inner membrane protein OXA1-like [Apostasia shenzhenica]|uniref:Mitochondrial inner membrane protein OXA1-like n=1 Tax=Apostasia shenzhenica TaxID=1088818 RepID=A0A2H9ZTB7_9ASPA|nr:Mitochondrial inner membrane protein OXA1-like [Apostasia shenzhenica]